MSRQCLLVIGLLSIIGGSACSKKNPENSHLTIDSAHAFAVDATITQGMIHTTSKASVTMEKQIRAQLLYLIGQLNGVQGGPQLNELQIKINEAVAVESGGYDVRYEAHLVLAWPQGKTLPESYEIILPAKADRASLSNFLESLKEDCVRSTDHDLTTGNFWYYYRPKTRACATRLAESAMASLVVNVPMTMTVSDANTSGKAPEYDKIWEDNRLVVTAVFGKYEANATENADPGIAAFNEMYALLRRTWGEPSSQNVEIPPDSQPGSAQPSLHMIFKTTEGDIDIDLLLVDSIASVDEAFMQRYSERTQISDFVSYNGHSGLGSNIRALARMGSFTADQYQIFFINGCDTFAYVDNALWEAHAAVNPDAAPTKFLDMITNAMPSYFHSNADNNGVMIRSLLERQKTYRDILADFDRSQRALVIGEEDNAWPQSF
jgi:hypothetical protein